MSRGVVCNSGMELKKTSSTFIGKEINCLLLCSGVQVQILYMDRFKNTTGFKIPLGIPRTPEVTRKKSV